MSHGTIEPNVNASTAGRFEQLPTDELVKWVWERFGHQRLVLTTSFGMEGCVLVDLFARLDQPLDVVYLDTHFFFPETYALRDRMIERYPHLRFLNRGTALTPERQEELYGPELWRRNPDRCCALRRVEPMRAALAGVDVWVTGITRSQSATRAETPLVGWDWQFQLVKVSPLAGWDRARVWAYVQEHGVPYNPLHERGYPTIGCTHCTVPVPDLALGAYTRAGRWAGTDKTECGLHYNGEAVR